ncbi:hypothetical protein [Actinomycetospora straminea]|uniref:ABC transporter permease n=1 Tax=Actinomycetospora straminea TaxID=663607 RepID=A0ABP9E5A1_9PSEU|nr:hypothetical protein [Actinomycetospora straminea]MDD7931067.1 hypothetical protein [Actinomycetospora straminea]
MSVTTPSSVVPPVARDRGTSWRGRLLADVQLFLVVLGLGLAVALLVVLI